MLNLFPTPSRTFIFPSFSQHPQSFNILASFWLPLLLACSRVSLPPPSQLVAPSLPPPFLSASRSPQPNENESSERRGKREKQRRRLKGWVYIRAAACILHVVRETSLRLRQGNISWGICKDLNTGGHNLTPGTGKWRGGRGVCFGRRRSSVTFDLWHKIFKETLFHWW